MPCTILPLELSSRFNSLLLECDKSFTRSDALAKHMRTVHEIETGRPPDMGGRAQPALEHKAKRRRSPSHPENGEPVDDYENRSEGEDENAAYSSTHRHRYLKRKLRWVTERNISLRNALQDAETSRWRNWVAKEALLDRVLERENVKLA